MSLRLGKDVRDTLRSQAELRGISESQLAREALEAWLKTESLGVAPDLEDGVQALPTRPPSISELEAALQEAHHTRHDIVRSAGLAQTRGLNKFEKMLADREQRLAEALADRDRTLLQREEAEKAAREPPRKSI